MSKKALAAKLAALQKEAASVARKMREYDEVSTGEKPAPSIAVLIKTQSFSFGVAFIRRKARASGEAVKISNRRFSSAKEANQHGSRFTKKHGHKGYLVTYLNARANAWVNWRTGKTNPVV